MLGIRKKCPKCSEKAVRLYQNRSKAGTRKWIPIAWICTKCNYVYTVASDTLVYPLGGNQYKEAYHQHCPKCDQRLTRVYQHKNPVKGKQQWISKAWYCRRCKYIWI